MSHDAELRYALRTIERAKAPLSFRLVLTLMKRYRAEHSGDWMKHYLHATIGIWDRGAVMEEPPGRWPLAYFRDILSINLAEFVTPPPTP